MKLSIRLLGYAALGAVLLPISTDAEDVRVGAAAPAFTATDSRGQSETLAQYRGKYVVLEWHNQGCPFTRKHYVSGNMQALQKEWTAKGVVWFTVISSARGQQGYLTSSEENAYIEKVHAVPTAVLMDSEGKLGRLYSAKTTPQMVVIDPAGKVIYDGAIDDRPTTDPGDVRGARNYVSEALTEAMAGKACGDAVYAAIRLWSEVSRVRKAGTRNKAQLQSGRTHTCAHCVRYEKCEALCGHREVGGESVAVRTTGRREEGKGKQGANDREADRGSHRCG